MILLFDKFGVAEQEFYNKKHQENPDSDKLILSEKEPTLGFLEVYCKYILKQPLPVDEKGLYYIFLPIPKFWEIRAKGSKSGIICNAGKKVAQIMFHQPEVDRLVKKVDWISEAGTVYKSDLYSSYGFHFCSVNFSAAVEPEYACFFGRDGKETFALNYSNSTMITFLDGQIGRIFSSFSDFRGAVLSELKKQEQQTGYQEN